MRIQDQDQDTGKYSGYERHVVVKILLSGVLGVLAYAKLCMGGVASISKALVSRLSDKGQGVPLRYSLNQAS